MEPTFTIQQAETQHISVIAALAEATWWPTYSPILSKEQIRFMLDKMFNTNALARQMTSGMRFYLIQAEEEPVGFLAVISQKQILRIEKLYLKPNRQKSGLGTKLIQHAQKLAKEAGCTFIELNVNRQNPALDFYKKVGFKIIQEVDIPYYQFFMNDYVLQLRVVE